MSETTTLKMTVLEIGSTRTYRKVVLADVADVADVADGQSTPIHALCDHAHDSIEEAENCSDALHQRCVECGAEFQ